MKDGWGREGGAAFNRENPERRYLKIHALRIFMVEGVWGGTAFNREHPERMNLKIHTLRIFMVEWGWQWGGDPLQQAGAALGV